MLYFVNISTFFKINFQKFLFVFHHFTKRVNNFCKNLIIKHIRLIFVALFYMLNEFIIGIFLPKCSRTNHLSVDN